MSETLICKCGSDWVAQIGSLPDMCLVQHECLRCGEVFWAYDWSEWEEETA